MPRKLHRSRKDRMLFGVLGGLAEYFGVDSALVRVIFVISVLATGGLGILAYIVMAILFPLEGAPGSATPEDTIKQNVKEMRDTAQSIAGGLKAGLSSKQPEPRPAHRQGFVAGLILILLGIIFLMVNLGYWKWLSWDRVWPVLLMLFGILLVAGIFRRRV